MLKNDFLFMLPLQLCPKRLRIIQFLSHLFREMLDFSSNLNVVEQDKINKQDLIAALTNNFIAKKSA